MEAGRLSQSLDRPLQDGAFLRTRIPASVGSADWPMLLAAPLV